MELRIERDALLNGLRAVANVVKGRTTLPILNNVLIEADTGRVRLTCSDIEMTVAASVEANVHQKGRITLPARRMLEVAQFATGDEIAISIDDKNVAEVRYGRSLFKVRGLSPSEFPETPDVKGEPVKLSQSTLRRMLNLTAYAQAPSDMGRFVMEGVCFELNGDLRLSASDGRRVASVKESGITGKMESIVPTKAVSELMRLLSDGDVEVVSSESRLLFRSSAWELSTKLVEGRFPNINNVIPSNVPHVVTLNRVGLLESLRRVRIMASEKWFSVKLELSPGELAISIVSSDAGEASESIQCDYKGKSVTIGIDPKFLIDFLSAAEEESIEFGLIDSLSPAVLRVDGALYVVMGVRLS